MRTVLNSLKPAKMAPFQQRYLLYAVHTFFAFTSRMWDMGIVLMIAHVTNNDLKIVALAGFMSTVSVFLFMGSIGHYLDATNRLSAAFSALTVKIIVVTLAYCVCAFLAEEPFYSSKFICILPCASAVASLCFNALNQSIEKDWVVVLADKDFTWLTTTNSTMSQIDLACASFAPALTGRLSALAWSYLHCVLVFMANLC
ncbi:hypothetical protein EON65_33925 [archaeon]|nr:MAG: hypothetical protein EON65_33925 [archaeon]